MAVALRAYFQVGLPGGKTMQRYEELIAALDTDQPGASVEWSTLFLEDKEFSQGVYVWCVVCICSVWVCMGFEWVCICGGWCTYAAWVCICAALICAHSTGERVC